MSEPDPRGARDVTGGDDATDAFLALALRAARTVATTDVDDGAATRLRLRESVAARGQSHRRRLGWCAGILATLAGSTAFAYQAGWRPAVTAARTTIERAVTSVATLPEAMSRSQPPRSPVVVAAPIDTVTPPPTVAVIAPTASPTASPTPSPRRPAHPAVTAPRSRVDAVIPSPTAPSSEPQPTPIVAPPPPVPAATTSADLAAYRRAHEAHFRGSNPAAALAAWDAYLSAFPRGELATDARYNRALVLVKLERYAEARTALEPFATAPVGTYRQHDAVALLAAIRDR